MDIQLPQGDKLPWVENSKQHTHVIPFQQTNTSCLKPLAIQAMLVLFSLFCLMFSPETPRYLVEKGRPEEGHRILARLYGQEYADGRPDDYIHGLNGQLNLLRRGHGRDPRSCLS